MSSFTTLTTLLGLAASVSAHGFVSGIDVAGTYYTGYLVNQYPYESSAPDSIGWAESATDLGFVSPSTFETSSDIVCHKSAVNAAISATVAAGSTVTMYWNTWPESHHGPIIDYLAKCAGNDCTTVDKTTLEFVKIAESGLISDTTSPGKWASDTLIAANNSWAITIPSTIAPGNYVLRHEIIALHSAGSADGAQNYPQCINLEITGSGTDAPAGTLGQSLYTETDPGILVNIYTTGLSYTIPGPALYTAGSSGATATGSAAVVGAATTSAAQGAKTTAASVAVTPTTLQTVTKAASTAAAVETGAADDECEA